MIGFLQNSNGEKSSMRLAMGLVVAVVAIVWGVCAIKTPGGSPLPDIPQGVLWLVGVMVTGKVGQATLAEKNA